MLIKKQLKISKELSEAVYRRRIQRTNERERKGKQNTTQKTIDLTTFETIYMVAQVKLKSIADFGMQRAM